MYKNIKILRKNETLNKKFSKADVKAKLEVSKLVPLGVGEVFEYASILPVIISGGNNNEFVLFPGLSHEKNIFTECKYIKEPKFLSNYPFLMLQAKNEKNEDISVIGFDDNEDYIGENKDFLIFEEDKELSISAKKLIDDVKILHTQRELSRKLISELKEKDLLVKQTFNINIDGEIKPILSDYYIINRQKLLEIDDITLSLWAKKGWIGIIDAHLNSIKNFQSLVDLLNK